MIQRFSQIVALCGTIFLGSCSRPIEPLDHGDLERWVRAYGNIASISPKLLDQKRAVRASTLLTCSACRSTLEEQVVKAGYPNLPAFLVIDTRIKAAQVNVLHRQMTKALDSLDREFQADTKEPCVSSGPRDQNQQMVEHGMTLVCWVLAKKVEQMRKTSEVEDAIISKMTIESDVVFVGKNYATLDRAMSDQRLIEDYRIDLSSEEKNSPDPQRLQACNRLELGLGDDKGKTKCPAIRKTPRST